MGKLEDRQNKLYLTGAPPETPAPDANSSNAVSPMIDRQNKLYPTPAPSDEEVTSHNFWNLPPNISQGDYWGAEGRKMTGAFKDAATDVGKVYADDASFGAGTAVLAASRGQSPADYRADVDAARQRVGASRYGIDTMAFLTSPFKYLRAGKAAEGAALAGGRAIAPNATNAAVQIAKRVGNFVEGAGYSGLESLGHGDDPETIAANAAGGGILSTGLGEVAQQIAPGARWLRTKLYGTPEGSPSEIASGPPPGTLANSPLNTATRDLDANQLNLWRSKAKYGMPPDQPAIRSYATKVYGDDPAQWPAALRDLNEDVGGGESPWKSTAAHVATQAGTATANYLGLGLNPEVAAMTHPVVAAAIDFALPRLGLSTNSAARGVTNACPALTGWRPNVETPDWRY